jgi:hypothetical protein
VAQSHSPTRTDLRLLWKRSLLCNPASGNTKCTRISGYSKASGKNTKNRCFRQLCENIAERLMKKSKWQMELWPNATINCKVQEAVFLWALLRGPPTWLSRQNVNLENAWLSRTCSLVKRSCMLVWATINLCQGCLPPDMNALRLEGN